MVGSSDLNLFKFMKVPLMPSIPEHEKTPIKGLFSSKLFLLALVLMLCAGAAELTMAQWASLFAEKGLQVPKLVGDILGPCLFAVFMGIGRTVYGIWGEKIHLEKALLASGALSVICYATTVFVQNPIISLLGCALCGLSVALMWPGTFSLSAATFPKGGTAMFGILAIFGDIGAAIGPWMAGLTSDLAQTSNRLVTLGSSYGLNAEQLGLKTGLFVGMLFPLILLFSLILMKYVRGRDVA